jgi:hypothetical protein
MELHAIEMARAGALASGPGTTDPAREIQVMLFETLLRQSGLLQPLGGDTGEASQLMELWLPILARELAEQMRQGMGQMAAVNGEVYAGQGGY